MSEAEHPEQETTWVVLNEDEGSLNVTLPLGFGNWLFVVWLWHLYFIFCQGLLLCLCSRRWVVVSAPPASGGPRRRRPRWRTAWPPPCPCRGRCRGQAAWTASSSRWASWSVQVFFLQITMKYIPFYLLSPRFATQTSVPTVDDSPPDLSKWGSIKILIPPTWYIKRIKIQGQSRSGLARWSEAWRRINFYKMRPREKRRKTPRLLKQITLLYETFIN